MYCTLIMCKLLFIQDFTLESKCSCPYKEGESSTSEGGGSHNGGGNSNSGGGGKSTGENIKDKLGVLGIVLLCMYVSNRWTCCS